MSTKVYAAFRLIADADSWFNSLSKEQQTQYIEMHPGSKYAKNKNSISTDKKNRALTKDPKSNSSEQLKNAHAFSVSKEAAPGSKTRSKLGSMIVRHAKGLVKHLKDEVKDAGIAGHSVTKLLRGKQLSDNEKHALKSTCVRLVIVCSSLAIGGGLISAAGHGIKHVAAEIANDFMAHSIINVAEKTLMHSTIQELAVKVEDDADSGLEELTKRFANYMANSPNIQRILQESLKK